MSKKLSSVEWLIGCISEDQMVKYKSLYEWLEIFEQAKAMHKEEMKMIIEHYHNSLFYLELSERELENITKIIYKELFGGQDNE